MRLISFIRNILIIFLISTNQSYSNPLDKLFDKKWSLGGLPCNFKGGAYSRYSPEIAGGSDFFSNGKFNKVINYSGLDILLLTKTPLSMKDVFMLIIID